MKASYCSRPSLGFLCVYPLGSLSPSWLPQEAPYVGGTDHTESESTVTESHAERSIVAANVLPCRARLGGTTPLQAANWDRRQPCCGSSGRNSPSAECECGRAHKEYLELTQV